MNPTLNRFGCFANLPVDLFPRSGQNLFILYCVSNYLTSIYLLVYLAETNSIYLFNPTTV
jgi:hypothetical protein